MSNRKLLLKGFKWSTIGTIGLALFQLLQLAILTRLLPKEAFGLIALAVLVVNFTNIFVEMGITSAILHVRKASSEEYSSLYWLNIGVSTFLYLMVYYLSPLFADFYNESELTQVVRLLGLNLIFIALGQQHRTLLQKDMRLDVIAKVNIFAYVIGLIVAVALAYNNYGVYSLVYSTLISSLIASILFLTIRMKSFPVKLHFKIKETRRFLKVGVFSLGSNVLDFTSREVDIIIIGRVLPSETLGVYSLVKQISLKLYSVLMPIIFNVLNPYLAKLNDSKKQLESAFLKIVYSLVNITYPLYLILILAAEEIISVFYGEQYSYAYKVLVYMSIFQASFSVIKPLGSLQIATGKTNVGFYWTILRNFVTVILLLFINKVGFNSIEEIALSIAILSLILLLVSWPMQIKKMTSVSFKNYFNQFNIALFALLMVSFLKVIILDKYISFNVILINGIFKVVIGIFVYSLIVYALDRNKIVETIKTLIRG